MGSELELLDVTDRTRRIGQHSAVFAGIAVLLIAGAVAKRPDSLVLAVWMIGGGLALMGAASLIKQRWTLNYKGHELRFENNPFLGEKLLIDNKLAGKGKVGFRSETRAVISDGDGIGDTVIVRTEAGLFTLRCRITVETPEATAVPPAVSDEQLLAEVRRRGLTDRS
jgi:hypothetical protein